MVCTFNICLYLILIINISVLELCENGENAKILNESIGNGQYIFKSPKKETYKCDEMFDAIAYIPYRPAKTISSSFKKSEITSFNQFITIYMMLMQQMLRQHLMLWLQIACSSLIGLCFGMI